ncbi:MAG: metal-dependent transcriptional regulator, partial [Crocinitomicaceae bacterium]
MNSFAEENYLKAIFKLVNVDGNAASTNSIAEEMQTKAPSVT